MSNFAAGSETNQHFSPRVSILAAIRDANSSLRTRRHLQTRVIRRRQYSKSLGVEDAGGSCELANKSDTVA